MGLYLHVHRENITQGEVVIFLSHLLQHIRGPIVLLWDGGGIHKGGLVKRFLRRHPRLHTERFPPYAPELNPDEQVWNYVKHHGVAKAALRGGQGELRKLVLARLRSLQKLPWTIRMFFLTPDTQYAAN